MTAAVEKLEILQGETFRRIVRWEGYPIVYKNITAITKAAPAVVTVPTHGLVDGWRVAITNTIGMTQINAKEIPPRDPEDYTPATVIDANTVELNRINAAGYGAYTSGGVLQYFTPVDFDQYTARMKIRPDLKSSTVLYSLSSDDGTIVLNNAAKTIMLLIPAADTEQFTWVKGVYDLEMVSPDVTPVVTRILRGTVKVLKESTR